MSDDDALLAADLPGLASLSAELRELVLAAAAGDPATRRTLAMRAADVVGVFAALDLLQFVYVPPPDEPAGGAIDLIAPPAPAPEAVAWFGVDEVAYDDFRDAVTLFGDLADILNPPIVLDAADEDEGEEEPAPSVEPPERLY